MDNYIVTFEYRVMVTAFAILAMFYGSVQFYIIVEMCLFLLCGKFVQFHIIEEMCLPQYKFPFTITPSDPIITSECTHSCKNRKI